MWHASHASGRGDKFWLSLFFSFNTEDFTSNTSANAILREAQILSDAGIRGCFVVVGLLAWQLKNWQRKNIMWSARKQPTEICGHEEPKPRGQAMWSKAIAKSKWMWYNKYADIAKRPSRRAYNPEALVWLQLPLYRFNMKISLWEQGSELPAQGLFLLPSVSYCNSCEGLCQAFFAVCLLLVGRTRRA